jgi:hypothetical protein
VLQGQTTAYLCHTIAYITSALSAVKETIAYYIIAECACDCRTNPHRMPRPPSTRSPCLGRYSALCCRPCHSSIESGCAHVSARPGEQQHSQLPLRYTSHMPARKFAQPFLPGCMRTTTGTACQHFKACTSSQHAQHSTACLSTSRCCC